MQLTGVERVPIQQVGIGWVLRGISWYDQSTTGCIITLCLRIKERYPHPNV